MQITSLVMICKEAAGCRQAAQPAKLFGIGAFRRQLLQAAGRRRACGLHAHLWCVLRTCNVPARVATTPAAKLIRYKAWNSSGTHDTARFSAQ